MSRAAATGLPIGIGKLDPRKNFLSSYQSIGAAMITSTLTRKAQTTIPLPVCKALRLGAGDKLAYRIDGDCVVLTKATREAADDPLAAFSEWSSEADTEAYADL